MHDALRHVHYNGSSRWNHLSSACSINYWNVEIISFYRKNGKKSVTRCKGWEQNVKNE